MTEREIIEKYWDNVTPEYKMAMDAISMSFIMLNANRPVYEVLLKAEQDMHNFGGLRDPTLYKDMLQSQNLKRQIEAIQAVMAFLRAIDEVKTKLKG